MNYAKTAMLLAAMTALFVGVGFLIGGEAGMLIALVFAVGTNAWAWWNSDKMVLRMHNARPVTRDQAPEFVGMVQRLADRAGLPMPAVYVMEEDQPNAFATGRNPENAAVAATTGLLRGLSAEEIEGVMAHELAHVQNRDTLIMTISAALAGAISMLAQFGFFFGGGRDRGGAGIIGVLLAVIVAPLAAMMIQMLISRTREYAADRLAGEITGHPMALASALAKIAGLARNRVMESAERSPATAHMFIMNPLTKGGVDTLFSTHPSPQNRIDALKRQAAEMGRTASLGAEARAEAPSQRSRIPSTRRAGPWS